MKKALNRERSVRKDLFTRKKPENKPFLSSFGRLFLYLLSFESGYCLLDLDKFHGFGVLLALFGLFLLNGWVYVLDLSVIVKCWVIVE